MYQKAPDIISFDKSLSIIEKQNEYHYKKLLSH